MSIPTTHDGFGGLQDSFARFNFSKIREKWGWFLFLGALLFLLGIAALSNVFFTTIVSVVFFGYLLMIGGFFEVIQAFAVRTWQGFFLFLFCGILSLVVGSIIVMHPAAWSLTFSVLIMAYLLVSGLVRIISAFALELPYWGWIALSGVINIALAAMIWAGWPYSGEEIIGIFVGVELLFYGWAVMMLALSARPKHHEQIRHS